MMLWISGKSFRAWLGIESGSGLLRFFKQRINSEISLGEVRWIFREGKGIVSEILRCSARNGGWLRLGEHWASKNSAKTSALSALRIRWDPLCRIGGYRVHEPLVAESEVADLRRYIQPWYQGLWNAAIVYGNEFFFWEGWQRPVVVWSRQVGQENVVARKVAA